MQLEKAEKDLQLTADEFAIASALERNEITESLADEAMKEAKKRFEARHK
jgi:hypothetical protein